MEKKIFQDNKQYTFNPGKNGSLTAIPNYQKTQPTMDFKRKAKVVVSPEVRKKRNTLAPAIVGSNRG